MLPARLCINERCHASLPGRKFGDVGTEPRVTDNLDAFVQKQSVSVEVVKDAKVAMLASRGDPDYLHEISAIELRPPNMAGVVMFLMIPIG